VPAPLMEPDEVSGAEDQEESSSSGDDGKPSDATATVPSVRITSSTRRDPELTQGSLSVTHGGRSQGRRRNRNALVALVALSLPIAGAGLFFTFGRPAPHLLEARNAERLRLASQAVRENLPKNTTPRQTAASEARTPEEVATSIAPHETELRTDPAPAKPAAPAVGTAGLKTRGSETSSGSLVAGVLGAAALFAVGAVAPADFLAHFTVFVLACFVGYMVVWNVTPALHTPLMSVTNAISSIILIGGLLQVSSGSSTIMWIAALTILLTSINIAGGFAVTRRMLEMFRK